MPLLRAKFWLTALTLISAVSFLSAQPDICETVKDDGSLKVKPKQWERLDEVCKCTGVKELNLKKSPALKLPECFEDLVNLRTLDLSKSALATFPSVVTKMYSIEHLSLAHTDIHFLPDEVADLVGLKTLDLRGTKIEALPEGLNFLEKIDMRLIMMSKLEQDEIRARFPRTEIFFSSPCHCN
ncbi:MAG: leucine-rich repeat domain-containing protein [Cryomorphaceae bacterium]|nr:hypothetical protein [Flavobacteriales bacterium]